MSIKKLLSYLELEIKNRREDLLSYNWKDWARPTQFPPQGNWRIWIILAGRGFGKTRAGAETLRLWIHHKLCRRLAIIGETRDETRQVMIEGPSGLLATHPPSERPFYSPSRNQLFWPNGAIATCFSAEAYEHLRGPQFDGAWVDELAKFKDAHKVWDQLMFSLRLGKLPRAIVTTTPRPTQFLKKLLTNPAVVVTTGSTFENEKNLAAPFLEYMTSHYGKSAIGRQELYAEVIEDTPGGLWTRSLVEKARANYQEKPLKRLIIAIDPAVSHGEKSDETGIIVAGLAENGVGVILEDLSLKASPSVWIHKAIEAYHRWKADRIVAEVNMGGDLVEQLLRTFDTSVSYKAVRATRGKTTRAEPISALYEQGKVLHARHFPELEDQLCSYVPGKGSSSPDRLDALVWALSELMLTHPSTSSVRGIWGA